MSTRAALGAVEMAMLAALPAVLLPAFLPLVKEAHPVPVALHFILLWVVCGAPIFALGFLSSAVLAGEYGSLIASMMVVLSYVYFTSPPFFRPSSPRFSLFRVMMGMNVEGLPFDRRLNGLPEPFPWMTLLMIVVASFVLFAISVHVTKRRDF